jgi:hypothetical protein
MSTEPKHTEPGSEEQRRYPRREPDLDFIKAWPVVEDGVERELIVRKDAVAWAIAGKAELAGKTILGLRTAGAKAIPISAPYAAVKAWWTDARPRKTEGKAR